jgi:hypothetical protein
MISCTPQKRKAEVERKAKIAAEIAHKKIWGWKAEGQQTYSNVKDAFHGIETVLVPHHLKRCAMRELLEYVQKSHEQNISSSFIFRNFSRIILNEIFPFSIRQRKKRNVIARKQVVMRQIRQINRTKYLIHHHEALVTLPDHISFEYIPYPLAVLPMEASFHSRIPLRPAKLMHLKMLKSSFENASQRVRSIQENLEKIAQMVICTSVYHERSAGCLKCGGLIRQHELMVNAVNRATGAMILVPYQFEIQVLQMMILSILFPSLHPSFRSDLLPPSL